MNVISLEVENFKRVRAVSITPEGGVIEVTGDNGEGKTSTLDAIWAALGGKDACPDKPIHSDAEEAVRAGEAKSEVRVVLGEGGEAKFKVTRRFKLKEGAPYTTDVIVESAEGARFSKPQDILNAMLGEFCFDPVAFTRLKDEEQIKALRRFVPDVDFANLEGLNKRDFEERTELNRRARDLRAQAAALPVVAGEAPERVDLDALQKKLAEASEHNSLVEQRRVRRENTQARLKAIADQIAVLHTEQAELEEALKTAAPLPAVIDVQEVSAALTAGRETNALLDRLGQRALLEERASAAEQGAAELTSAIDKRKEAAADAVRRAKMPIEGLGFGDGVITLNGEPFSQASMAQKIRASVAIAAAMNPRLRVARIADGSLLDRKSWAALQEYATTNDLQVWVETVDAKSPAAVMIQDGGVVGAGPVADPGDVV